MPSTGGKSGAKSLGAAAVRSAGGSKRAKAAGSGFSAPRAAAASDCSAGGNSSSGIPDRPPPPAVLPAARAASGDESMESGKDAEDSGEDIPPPVQAKFPTARPQKGPVQGAISRQGNGCSYTELTIQAYVPANSQDVSSIFLPEG